MLNGIDPIILIQLKKLSPSVTAAISKIPVVSSIVDAIGLPPIPIYLSEKLTGIFIESEDKSIDIETTTETLTSGGAPIVNQKAIQSVVKVNMVAHRDSLGLTVLSACMDLLLPKVTSKEYSITYLHGAATVFGGLLHSFTVNGNSDNELLQVTLELQKSSGEQKKEPPKPTPSAEDISLQSGQAVIPPTAPLPAAPLTGPPPQAPSPPPVSMPGLG